MTVDPALRRSVLGCLLLGFRGPTPPGWLLTALQDGLGGVVLFGSNVRGNDPRRLTDRLRDAAGRDIVVALDEEGGDVTRLDDAVGSASPGAAALGHLDHPATTEEVYALLGTRLAAAGVTLDLAPVADVNVEPRNPVIGVRSFGSDGEVAARHVAAAVRGIQRAGVAACAKHFPGHGATVADSHHEVPTLDRTEHDLRSVEFEPFRAAIAAGTRAIMTGHLLVPALDPDAVATVSRSVTRDILRDELGFAGTVVTDALEMRAVSGPLGIVEGFVRALAAGADAIETGALEHPDVLAAVPEAVATAVADGLFGADRVVDAAARTAELAAAGDPGTEVDRGAAERAAAGCVEVVGALPPLRAPVVVECRPPGGMASGDLPWSLAQPLAELVPGTEALTVADARGARRLPGRWGERSVVVVVRDPARHEWQLEVLRATAGRPGTVVVDAGWPTAGTPAAIRTRGVAPGLMRAAAALLAGGAR